MNKYEIEVNGLTTRYGRPWQTIAETASAAKYACFKYFTDELNFNLTFKDFLGSVAYCTKIGSFKAHHLFDQNDNFEQMKEHRDIQFAYRGMKVEVYGRKGILVGNCGDNLAVCFEGESWKSNCHPGDQVKYFDATGNILLDTTRAEKTKCGECKYFNRCSELVGVKTESVGCDFSPSKFSRKEMLQ